MANLSSIISTISAAISGPLYQLKPDAIFDFSGWEGVPDWSKVIFPDGTRALITKATEGQRFVDPVFTKNYKAFQTLPFIRGAYHFFEPNNISGQIINYTTQMKLGGWTKEDWPPILDIEFDPPPENKRKPDNLPRGAAYAYQVKVFLDGIEKEMGVRPIGYINKKCADAMGNPSWMNDYWWWLAWYPDTAWVDKNKIIPDSMVPSGLKREKIAGWQYRTDWRLPGIPWDGVDVSTANPAFLATLRPSTGPAPLPSHVLELHHADTGSMESVSFAGMFRLDAAVDYVAIDSMRFVTPTPEPAPEPEPEPTPGVDNTIKYGILKTQIIQNGLTLNGKYTPAVVQIQDQPRPDGKKGMAIPILPDAANYIRKINDQRGARYALETVGAMWINSAWQPPDSPKGESISCQHNFVSWKSEENGCAKLQCFMNDEKFDSDPARVNWHTQPDLFFKAIAVNLDGRFINVQDDVDCFIPLMARRSNNGTGELWLALNEIEPFAELPVNVRVEASALNIRKTPGMDGEDIGGYKAGEEVTLLQYRPLGASVWARTDKGWICLLLAGTPGQREFLTSWRLETEGVIPPG